MQRQLRTRAFDLARERGWTYRVLAQRTGLTESAFMKVRAGIRRIGPTMIEGVAAAFPDQSFEELFYLEEDSPPKTSSRYEPVATRR